MRFVMAAVLAVTAGAACAEETVKSTISGNLTIKFESDAPAEAGSLTEEQKKLQGCEKKWAQKFAENKKAREQAEMQRAKQPSVRAAPPPTLTRVAYRTCMYECLSDRPPSAC